MKVIYQIWLIVLAVVVILATAGISVTKHECKSCKTSSFYFNSNDHKHEHCNNDSKHIEQNSCCSESSCSEDMVSTIGCNSFHSDEDLGFTGENCCEEDNFYIKIQEEYTIPSNKLSNLEISKIFIISFIFIESSVFKTENIFKKIIKPPKLFGKYLLNQISVLIL